jgi:hypothetical protein
MSAENHLGLPVKWLLLLSDFKQKRSVPKYFSKTNAKFNENPFRSSRIDAFEQTVRRSYLNWFSEQTLTLQK